MPQYSVLDKSYVRPFLDYIATPHRATHGFASGSTSFSLASYKAVQPSTCTISYGWPHFVTIKASSLIPIPLHCGVDFDEVES